MTAQGNEPGAKVPGPGTAGTTSSTVRYVVGYGGDKRSREAVKLAAVMARAFNAQLEIVCVLRADDPYQQVYPPVGDISPMLRQQASGWLRKGLELVPDDVAARTHIRTSPSIAGGLLDAVTEFGAGLIVVGAASGKYTATFSVGPVTDTLLHRATVPVALTPRGYKGTEPITRMYAGVGMRPGAQRVIDVARRAVQRTGLDLVLVSFLPLDQIHGEPEQAIDAAREKLRENAAEIGVDHPVSVTVAQGKNLKETVTRMDWDTGSVLFVGSSRLAGDRQIFLGSTAARILRHLPVPMIVLPRGANDPSAPTADDRHEGGRGMGGAGPDEEEVR
ncbi:universal stress protein [Kocuria sp.]|uniref:universal stress protein n=1 Tax=Kocuria sp. TaxID=1871328 RepID=UPI002898672E|nr:universal stress protein [Kocuria sp.]